MDRMRLFGNMISKLSNDMNITLDYIGKELNCTEERLYSLLNGITIPTFNELEVLSNIFSTTPEILLAGDKSHYESTVVHCMNEFKNPQAREDILDIIENYVKLVSIINSNT
ncbi:MAG: hypothetical protein FWG88_08085 [Oscillospiraceae bacterium]|nr:hypothetical protein [Oscillospiraceae bacterium]